MVFYAVFMFSYVCLTFSYFNREFPINPLWGRQAGRILRGAERTRQAGQARTRQAGHCRTGWPVLNETASGQDYYVVLCVLCVSGCRKGDPKTKVLGTSFTVEML